MLAVGCSNPEKWFSGFSRKKIMKKNLVEIFASVSGASFVGMDTVTVPVLKGGKSNPMQGKITKRMSGASVMVFQNKSVNGYQAMVNRRLQAEGKDAEFTLSPRAWGERMEGLPIVEHKGKQYAEVIFLKPGKVDYYLDNKPISKADIIGMEADKSEGFQDGLDNKVIIRTFSADSITAIRIDGVEYN